MKKNNWKIVWLVGILIFSIGLIMSLIIHFQHWDEIVSSKKMFMYQIPAISFLIPGWIITMFGSFKK